MATLFDRQGKMHVTQPHTMTFNGKHNANVVKVLIVLSQLSKPVSLKQLCWQSGCPYESLKARMGFWFLIRYVNRELVTAEAGKPFYRYSIGDRGLKILFNRERVPLNILAKYINELNIYRQGKGLPLYSIVGG